MGLGRRYHIHTFGCQMNLADSERMAGALEAAGFACSPDPSDADVLIYNTCSIRDKAEQKVYSALGKQVKPTSGTLLQITGFQPVRGKGGFHPAPRGFQPVPHAFCLQRDPQLGPTWLM